MQTLILLHMQAALVGRRMGRARLLALLLLGAWGAIAAPSPFTRPGSKQEAIEAFQPYASAVRELLAASCCAASQMPYLLVCCSHALLPVVGVSTR